MERQPRKFTIHCICFLFAIIIVFLLCKWFSIRLVQNKSQESQLDIMMKRQIMEGAAFKNCLQHYERNMCEQYGSEEEFMAMMRMKEQQRINMKMLMERERNERNDSVNEPDRMHSIMERSNESGSLVAPADRQQESSLLMQSLMLDNSVCSSHSKRKSSKPSKNSRYSSKNSGIASKASKTRKASFNPSPNTSSEVSQSSASRSKVSSSNSTTSMSFDRQSSSSSSTASYMAPGMGMSPCTQNVMGSTGDNKKYSTGSAAAKQKKDDMLELAMERSC